MKFKDYFSLKHFIFALVVMALMLVFAVAQSNNTIKVNFNEDSVKVKATKYSMTIRYSDITSAELVQWPDLGTQKENGFDDDIVRYGTWENDTWGEYSVCADPDTGNCIVVHIQDGRTLVFSRKNDATTKEIFEELQTHIGK